jgi:hypothetical protein
MCAAIRLARAAIRDVFEHAQKFGEYALGNTNKNTKTTAQCAGITLSWQKPWKSLASHPKTYPAWLPASLAA